MNPKCVLYRALDRFRRTWLATKLFYRGVPVRTIRSSCTVIGIVQSVPKDAEDGDLTFGLLLDTGEFRHCEVTPCASDSVKLAARALRVGQRVAISGEERFDPAHLAGSADGWLEIHPVEMIVVAA
jgi:hypothetical protein